MAKIYLFLGLLISITIINVASLRVHHEQIAPTAISPIPFTASALNITNTTFSLSASSLPTVTTVQTPTVATLLPNSSYLTSGVQTPLASIAPIPHVEGSSPITSPSTGN